jgi:hypothetical protein
VLLFALTISHFPLPLFHLHLLPRPYCVTYSFLSSPFVLLRSIHCGYWRGSPSFLFFKRLPLCRTWFLLYFSFVAERN